MKRVGLVLGGVGGGLGLVATVALLILLSGWLLGGTATVAIGPGGLSNILLELFNGNVKAVVSTLLASDFGFALLGIAGVVYARRHTRLGSTLLIIAGIGLAVSGGAGFLFWVTSPLLVTGGILILLGERRQKSQA